MESMKGERWERTIERYNRAATAAAGRPSPALVAKFKDSFRQPSYTKGGGTVEVRPGLGLLYSWRRRRGSGVWHQAAAVDVSGSIVASVEPRSSEQYHLVIYRGSTAVWKSPETVSETCEITGGHIYYIAQTGVKLWNNTLMAYSLATGTTKHIFEEGGGATQLVLWRGGNRCLFLLEDNYQIQNLYHVHDGRTTVLARDALFFPVGNTPEDPCYFMRKPGGTWRPVGATLEKIRWPAFENREIEFIDLRHVSEPIACASRPDSVISNHVRGSSFVPNDMPYPSKLGCGLIPNSDLRQGLIVLREYGMRTLYSFREGAAPHEIHKGVFILEDFTHIWEGTEPMYQFIEPGATPWRGALLSQPAPYANTSYHKTDSADGTAVPYIVTSKAIHPRGLMVSIYGAYNMTSSFSFRHWKTWLEAGWAVVVAMIRGGGDHTFEWSIAAQASRRERAVEDAEAVVRAARRVTGLMASQTCIYGRSAGGYIVGALVNRHPGADLFGAVYTEAPFVDVLNTMSNPKLPASTAESNEFGNPLTRIEDLETMLRLSPVQNVPAGGTPALCIVCRTSLGDIEVAAYEPVKWITRLKTGYLFVKRGQGHFTEDETLFEDFARDFQLINNWLDGGKKSHE